MPWLLWPTKDVQDHDSHRGAVTKRLIRWFPNGATQLGKTQLPHRKVRGERAELKYLSKRRKRNRKRFP